jgi:hypothetical protein
LQPDRQQEVFPVRRLIYVLKKYEAEIRAALRSFGQGAAYGAGGAVAKDVYDHVKTHLRSKRIDYSEVHALPGSIPAGHCSFHDCPDNGHTVRVH